MWSITRDPITDLALEGDLQERLKAALASPDGPAVAVKIDEGINRQIDAYGLEDDGSWRAGWYAEDVVEAVLDLRDIARAVAAIDADEVVQDAVSNGADAVVFGIGYSWGPIWPDDGGEPPMLPGLRFAARAEADGDEVPTWIEHPASPEAAEAVRVLLDAARHGDISMLHPRLRAAGTGDVPGRSAVQLLLGDDK